MTIDKKLIDLINSELKVLFFSLNKSEKDLLLKKVLKYDAEDAPNLLVKMKANEGFLVEDFICDTPKKRSTLKKYIKADSHMLIYKSYYLLECALYDISKSFVYIKAARSPLAGVVRYTFSCLEEKNEYDLKRVFPNPAKNYIGTFFLNDYPYDEALELLLKPWF